jgi:hypothetical protein
MCFSAVDPEFFVMMMTAIEQKFLEREMQELQWLLAISGNTNNRSQLVEYVDHAIVVIIVICAEDTCELRDRKRCSQADQGPYHFAKAFDVVRAFCVVAEPMFYFLQYL